MSIYAVALNMAFVKKGQGRNMNFEFGALGCLRRLRWENPWKFPGRKPLPPHPPYRRAQDSSPTQVLRCSTTPRRSRPGSWGPWSRRRTPAEVPWKMRPLVGVGGEAGHSAPGPAGHPAPRHSTSAPVVRTLCRLCLTTCPLDEENNCSYNHVSVVMMFNIYRDL